jgi:hypothetical protein
MRRDCAIRSSLSPLPCPFPEAMKGHDAEPPGWRSDGDELNVAGVQAEVALREEAALAVDKNVNGVNGFQPLREQRHEPVVVLGNADGRRRG